MNNRKGQIDAEILLHPGFLVLLAMAVVATIIGWTMGPQMGFEERFPVWQLIVILVVEFIACYVIVWRSA